MWINPNHPNPPRQSEPPADDGRLLGAFPRGDGRDELRITLKEFEGRPYVALRVWSRGQDGQFWPVKGKGVSVRVGEIAGVVDALRSAQPETRRNAGPSRGPSRGPSAQPTRSAPSVDFDEFADDAAG